jgi:MYXO-CTERM domain-containing protein
LLSLLAAASASAAIVPGQIVVQTGDTPMDADGPVAEVQSPFVDSTGTLGFVGTLAGGEGFVFRDNRVIFHNSDDFALLIGGEPAMGHGPGDAFVFSPNIGTVSVDALYTDGGLFANTPNQAPGMAAGVTSTSYARPAMIDGGAIWWLMGVSDGGTQNRVLATSADGEVGSTMIVLEGGTMVDGMMLDTGAGGIDNDFQVSFDGAHRINVLGLAGGEAVVAVDDVIVATEGESADGEVNWQSFDLVAIDNAGNYAWSGDSDADAAANELIAYNGTIVLEEGQTVAGVVLAAGYTVRLLSLDDNGNMLHTWGAGTSDETVFLACDPANAETNSVYVIADGDELDFDGDMAGDGVFITDFSATSATSPQRGLGNDGSIYLEVVLDSGGEAIIAVEPPPCCGNGLTEVGEECDDDNNDDADACIACVAAVCGDGFVQAGVEECDDANDVDTDDCVACVAAACGDGFVQDAVEECDDGNDVDTDDCVTGCVPASCGDGFVQDGVEECDDGNDVDDDDCANDCTQAGGATGSTGGGSDDSGGDTDSTSGDGTQGTSATSPTGSGTTATTSPTTAGTDTDTDTDGDTGGGVGNEGCGCTTDTPMSPWATLLGLALFGIARRRRRVVAPL